MLVTNGQSEEQCEDNMWKILLIIFLISFFIFFAIMLHDARTLWSGFSFFFMMICLALFLLFLLYHYSEWLSLHEWAVGILVMLFLLILVFIMAFPVILILTLFVEGIRIIRHEGIKPKNLLLMVSSILLGGYLIVWPMIGKLVKNTFGTIVYMVISFSIVYILAVFTMYSLSAILNLVHLRKRRNADYIVVLGAGIIGKKVTPLLASRIEKGIELLRYNPNAVLIMSGGQGPGESIPEGEAMAAYAVDQGVERDQLIVEQKSVSTQENLLFSKAFMEKQKPKIIIVTTAYHVFRALILARKQGMKCVGFGAKTKWYFTLNAFIREFIGYLSITWKVHFFVIVAMAVLIINYRL